MALEVYFVDDIANALTAVTVAKLQACAACGLNIEYVRGVLDTSRAVSLSFGVPWALVKGELLACGNTDLIESVCKALPG